MVTHSGFLKRLFEQVSESMHVYIQCMHAYLEIQPRMLLRHTCSWMTYVLICILLDDMHMRFMAAVEHRHCFRVRHDIHIPAAYTFLDDILTPQ